MPKKITIGKSGPVPALKQKPSLKLRPPALLVQEHSGDFAQWKRAKTIDQPEESLFSFRNDIADVTEAVWQLSSAPMPPKDPSENFPGFLGTGLLQPPSQDQARTFSANWKAFTPNELVNGTTYYVRVVVKHGPSKSAAVASNMVEITVNKSKSSVKFTPKGLGQTVQQKAPDLYATPSLTVQLDLNELVVNWANEDADEPYLFAAVVYVDGTTINPLALSSSTVRIDSAKKTHGNVPDEDAAGEDLGDHSTAKIPFFTGHFERTITPIGLDFAADLEDVDGSLAGAIRNTTAVHLVVVALEEDATSTEAIDAARSAFVKTLRDEIEKVLQDGDTFDANGLKEIETKLRENALGAAEDETRFPLWWTPALFPFLLDDIVDKDDVVGFAVRKFSYGELLAAGTAGIPFAVNAKASPNNPADWEGSYTIRGKIRHK